ncbi:MAG: hypothetical protein ACRERE_34370 [Candidatus Entotheonellia bacterium]
MRRRRGPSGPACQPAECAGEDTAGLRVAEAEVGLDVISDGELVKTSFLAYAEERLTGFVPMTANDLGA